MYLFFQGPEHCWDSKTSDSKTRTQSRFTAFFSIPHWLSVLLSSFLQKKSLEVEQEAGHQALLETSWSQQPGSGPRRSGQPVVSTTCGLAVQRVAVRPPHARRWSCCHYVFAQEMLWTDTECIFATSHSIQKGPPFLLWTSLLIVWTVHTTFIPACPQVQNSLNSPSRI